MSNKNKSSSDDGLIGVIIIIALVVAAIVIIGSIGAFYGGGKAILNYGKAFQKNVAFEKLPIGNDNFLN